MPPRTWDKKAQRVKAGVQNAWAVWPKQTPPSAKAWATSSAVSTSAKGKPSAWKNGARVLSNGGQSGRGVEKDMETFLAYQWQRMARKASRTSSSRRVLN